MHTNIDNQLGVEAISYWVSKDPNLLPRNISKDFIINSLKIVLEYNTLTSDTDYYIRVRGTAMGTKVAPTYATLVTGFIEIRLYEQIEEKYGINIKNHFINKWWRYLDDCFLIWDTRIDSIENLLSIYKAYTEALHLLQKRAEKKIASWT